MLLPQRYRQNCQVRPWADAKYTILGKRQDLTPCLVSLAPVCGLAVSTQLAVLLDL